MTYRVSQVVQVSVWLQLLITWSTPVHGRVLGSKDMSPENSSELPASVQLNDGAEFDYVVVGAGAAGSAAAARLALIGFDVLLVEAGGDPNLLSKIPAAALALLGSDLDWQYKTIPNNESCLGSRGLQCRFSRGKCLGGSTSINHMLYSRGNRQDFEFNITDWSWKDIEPYFLRYEGLQVLDQFPISSIPYHNTTGILKINFFDDPQNPWKSRIINGFRELNFPYNRDINGPSQIGVSRVVGYVHEGERMSTFRGYLERKDVQRKLKVAKNTLCTGVIIDANNVTRGVTVLPKLATNPLRVFARNEVILSAGTVGTPQILMLSGIGPAKHLEEMNIPLRVDLPVGENLIDQVLPIVVVMVDSGINVLNDITGLFSKVKQLIQYLVSHKGPLASNGLLDINVYANNWCYSRKHRRLENTSAECELPTMQIIHSYIDRNLLPLFKSFIQQGTNLDDNAVNQVAEANINNGLLLFNPIVLKPYSRGNIRLASKNPSEPPAILPNYLSDVRDVDEMLRSIKIIEHLVKTPEFKKQNASILHMKFPGCPPYEDCRSCYWRCYVRHMTYSVFHAVGTCSLDRVVDNRLRVQGVQGLRVADASIFPSIPRGNTGSATIAVGERVVDFIQETLRQNHH